MLNRAESIYTVRPWLYVIIEARVSFNSDFPIKLIFESGNVIAPIALDSMSSAQLHLIV